MRSSTWTTVLVRSSLNHLAHANAFMTPLGTPLNQGVLEARHSARHLCPHSSQMERPTTLWSTITSGGDTDDSSSTRCEGDGTAASLPLPPKDDTYERFPLAILREWGLIPRPVDGSGRYDRIGKTTGGIWRTKLLGLTPVTVSLFIALFRYLFMYRATTGARTRGRRLTYTAKYSLQLYNILVR